MSTTTGVPMNRYRHGSAWRYYESDGERDPYFKHHEPGVWYPVAVAEARERVIAAARPVGEARVGATHRIEYARLKRDLRYALAALDALEGRPA